MDSRYLDLADFLLIAEAELGVEAEVVAKMANLPLADSALNAPAAQFGGVEFYPNFAMKAAVLCSRLAKNHPLPDGNKRVAYIATVEFVERNGYEWHAPAGDEGGDQTVATIVGVAGGSVDEAALAVWIADRLRPGEQ
ncbi:MAG: type II toxin-antitoxin system death-on-curing family toxin [Actinomycetota bacterium]